uniref:Cell surface glycoprotein MUC18-like n=2 Tax=Gouania willdenowi TaxID=441366 RepID=A0A8C5DR50_GOUWI
MCIMFTHKSLSLSLSLTHSLSLSLSHTHTHTHIPSLSPVAPLVHSFTDTLTQRRIAMALRDVSSLLLGLLVLCCGAWADVQVNMEDKVEAFLGDSAQITCMFASDDGIGAMIMQWLYVTRSGDKQRIYYQDATMKVVDRGTPYTDRISVNGTGATGEVVLTISNVQLDDELEFICLIKSLTDGIGEGRTRLRVFATPNFPTVEAVQTGISVSEDDPSKVGTCEVKNGYPKPNITWYRDNTPLRSRPGEVNMVSSVTTESSGLFSVVSELRMKVTKEDKDALFYCEVTYFVPGATLMTETSRFNITVNYPHTALDIWVESPKGKIKEGDRVELQCSGDGNPASSIFTFKHVMEEIGSDSNVYVLYNVSRRNSGVYECTVFDPDTAEEVFQNTTVFVNYLDSAVVMTDDRKVVHGEQLTATCNALSSLQTETTWFKEGEEISKGHTLILNDVTYDTAGTYMCVVTVPEIESMTTSSLLHVDVEGPPEIMEQDTELESYDKSVQLTCHGKGYPAPQITWTTSDGKVVTSTPTETEEGFESLFTVHVTSNITAVCNASNKYGADFVTYNIKAKSNGVIIAVIIICILLLAILGSVLYFLYKKGKICGQSGKQDLTKEKSSKDNIVVEMKSDNTEEAILLGVNGEKLLTSDQ